MDGKVLLLAYSAYERQKIRHILDTIGSFEIIEVGNISQFKLLKLNIQDLRLIIMDITFPTEIDGLNVLMKISTSEIKNVPVIVTSQTGSLELRSGVLKYSAKDFIVKPYNAKRLEASIYGIIRTENAFHYTTSNIDEISMSFDSYVEREIKFARRTNTTLAMILMTTLQTDQTTEHEQQVTDALRKSVFSISVSKAKEALRSTDTIVMNGDRDILIVLPCTEEAGARMVCEKIIKLSEPEFKGLSLNQNQVIYPVYVTFPKDGETFQQLMQQASKKISDKEMLEKMVSISTDARKYANRSYNRYRRWL
jgi:PleD family two-component response regulator